MEVLRAAMQVNGFQVAQPHEKHGKKKRPHPNLEQLPELKTGPGQQHENDKATLVLVSRAVCCFESVVQCFH